MLQLQVRKHLIEWVPGASIGREGGGGYQSNPDASFVKEL